MDNFQEQMEEIKQLKAEQALHRKQFEENRQRALAKRNQTKHLVTLGKRKKRAQVIFSVPAEDVHHGSFFLPEILF